MTDTPLRLFNSLTRQLEDFKPLVGNEARVYTCGPTVYDYAHIGNMRAYVFADTLGRALSFKGYGLKHIINITDVGHLTDDSDTGEDKVEKAAAAKETGIWEITQYYTNVYWADVKALNIREPFEWPKATSFVPQMIDAVNIIADKHCYELESGVYFDTSSIPDYGALARTVTNEGEGRIDAVDGKRHAADFAVWRKYPMMETRKISWGSQWGKGAPGWHLECSVMSKALLGFPFDIHTGGIDHREIHHPNEIAQNQALCPGLDEPTGARFWMHNNFLIDRRGKMSKSSSEFLRLQTLIDMGFHPLAYRMLCLQAHYRSELEFSWENLAAAFTRLKRIVIAVDRVKSLTGDFNSSNVNSEDGWQRAQFDQAISDDLNTARALICLEELLAPWVDADKQNPNPHERIKTIAQMDEVLGLNLMQLSRTFLRIRPLSATLTESDIEARLEERKAARAAKDFATSDRIRDDLIAQGVEVMDGDPLGWDWKLDI